MWPMAEMSCQIKKKLASYIGLKLAAQQRPRHPIELVIPDGSVIDRLVQRSKMREFVHERLESCSVRCGDPPEFSCRVSRGRRKSIVRVFAELQSCAAHI